ncbi:hypothetical protein ACW4YW_15220 [Methylobacillus pratensis]
MMVKAMMTVLIFNLVAPLAHKATAMRTKGTAGRIQRRPCAVSRLIGPSLLAGDVDSAMNRRGS